MLAQFVLFDGFDPMDVIGPLEVSMSGLVRGRHATTFAQGLDLLGAGGVQVVPGRVVDDGDLVTAGAITSGLDLGRYLLERVVGPKIARGGTTAGL
jgi:transcriptional regulator GlxA family with amidase domain